MFGLGWMEIGVIAVVALFVFGPERLPKVAADAGRMIRQLRAMAQNVTTDLKGELGPELADLDLGSLRDLRSMNPRAFVADQLFGDGPSGRGDSGPAVQRPSTAQRRPDLNPSDGPAPFDPDAT